jgi:hypothetical protein
VTTNFIPAYREPGLFGPADEGQQETQDAATAERESADLTLRHFTITIPLASIQMTTFFDLDTYEGSSRKMPKLRTLSTPPANPCEPVLRLRSRHSNSAREMRSSRPTPDLILSVEYARGCLDHVQA